MTRLKLTDLADEKPVRLTQVEQLRRNKGGSNRVSD